MNKITFQGPYTFLNHDGFPSIFASDIKNKRGIYIWTIPFTDKELIYYIGMTASQTFDKRLMQHLKGYLSGEYGINDPRELQKGKRVRIWDGLWRGADIENFIQRHDELFPKLFALVNLYRLYVAPQSCKLRMMERIESSIANHLYKQKGLVGNFQESEIHYRKRRDNEKAETIELVYDNRIHGLKEVLDV